MKHSDYIRSKNWKKLRLKVFERDNKWCQDCGVVEATEVHHLHYRNYLNEKMEDLISLCRICHGKRHGLIKDHHTVLDEEKMFGGYFNCYSHMVHSEIERIMNKND